MTDPKSPGDRAEIEKLAAYEREAQALREKTARLKALRLAKEAATAHVAPAKTAAKRAPAKEKRTGPAKKTPKASLAEWMRQEDESGRKR